jgi:hypothetical protein
MVLEESLGGEWRVDGEEGREGVFDTHVFGCGLALAL